MQYELYNRSTKASTVGNSNLIPVGGGGGDAGHVPRSGFNRNEQRRKGEEANLAFAG
jgi:hypothetical protein